jgi:hypothetical protein
MMSHFFPHSGYNYDRTWWEEPKRLFRGRRGAGFPSRRGRGALPRDRTRGQGAWSLTASITRAWTSSTVPSASTATTRSLAIWAISS